MSKAKFASMTSRRQARLAALCVAVLVLGVLVLGGCGESSKLSASETATWLHHRSAQGMHVACRPGRGNWKDWDYACTMTGRQVRGSAAENTYGFDVNGRDVTAFSG